MVPGAYRNLLLKEISSLGERSIIAIVNLMILDAEARRASDIHIDPIPGKSLVRLRIDGLLRQAYVLPGACHAELIARLKILSGLRIDEHLSPQDGRLRAETRTTKASFDVRISILPTQHGECAVLRLLTPRKKGETLRDLGFTEEQEVHVLEVLTQRYGMVLTVGPTGCGKTTTLYLLVQHLLRHAPSIVSIEDPIEYSIPGVRQIQVLPRVGLTFAEGLRAILRQDPDVIVVGEIRDTETASLAISAAHTGHLVLSTLHATNARGAQSRLAELNVSPTRLNLVRPFIIAQKLVATPCVCQGALPCNRCENTGIHGRRGEFELYG